MPDYYIIEDETRRLGTHEESFNMDNSKENDVRLLVAGPFASFDEATEHLIEACADLFEPGSLCHDLTIGDDPDWGNHYAIVKAEAYVQPTVNTTVDLRFKRRKPSS